MTDQTRYEISKVLVCSTSHFTDAEHCGRVTGAYHLRAFDTGNGSIVVVPYALAHKDADPVSERYLRNAIGDSIVDILIFAGRQLDCWAVDFDRDGPALPDFAVFDW